MPVQIAMALSGIDREQWGEFKELFDYGSKLMNQELPRSSRSRATNSTSSTRSSSPCSSSKESGIESMAAYSPIPLTLRDYCLFKLEASRCGDAKALKIIEIFDTAGKEPEPEKSEDKPYPVYTSELNWTGRNLLDLGANMKGNATMYQPARLRRGVESYFENRSQFSRLIGARPPPHWTEHCWYYNCDFKSQHF